MEYVKRPEFLKPNPEELEQSEPQEPVSYVKNPLTPEERDRRLDEIRDGVAKKLNKWADRIAVSMAFTPKIKRVDGERWEENGRIWEMKGKIAQTISSTQDAKMPWWCPQCTKAMNHKFDRKFYYLRGWCYNCNIEHEGQMRLNGTYEQWEKNVMKQNEIAFLKDKITEFSEYLTGWKAPTIQFENGQYEQLGTKADFAEHLEEVSNSIDNMLKRLEFLQQEDSEVQE
jgi:hypothetical protein